MKSFIFKSIFVNLLYLGESSTEINFTELLFGTSTSVGLNDLVGEDEPDLYFEEENSSTGKEQVLGDEIFGYQKMPPWPALKSITFFMMNDCYYVYIQKFYTTTCFVNKVLEFMLWLYSFHCFYVSFNLIQFSLPITCVYFV